MESPKYSKPLVSIGMPAYNGEKFIKRAIDSLLVQTYSNFELIVSDNASDDSTWEILNRYAAKDKRIRLYRQEYNIGALGNFRFVLSKASGKYFVWAAVDDLWMPGFVDNMVKELESHADAGIAMCAVDRVWENGELVDTIRFIDRDNPNHTTYYQMLKKLTSTKKYNLYIYGLFRTSLLEKAIQFMPEVPGSDRLFMSQMALATRFRYVDRVLHIRLHHRQPSNVRLPNEKFNKMQNEDKWVNIKILYALSQMLYQSTIIPWYRKIYLPVALWRYGWLLLYSRILSKIKERVAPDTWSRLRQYYEIFLRKRQS